MTKVVVKFKDGGYANLEADSLIQEDDFVTAYKRNGAKEIVERGLVFEIVGKFHQDGLLAIYLSETKS